MLRRLAYGLLGLALLSTTALGVGVLIDFNGLQYWLTATPSPNTKVPAYVPVSADGVPLAGTGGGGAGSQFVQGPDANGANPATGNPIVVAGVGSTGTVQRATVVINTDNLSTRQMGSGTLAWCDDVSPTAITENNAGIVRMGCADHAMLVSPQPYPNLATPITGSSGNVANAAATATLAANATKTTYISGFTCTAAGSTAAAVVNLTVTGLVTGTATYNFVFPAGVAVAAQNLVEDFPYPIPGSAVNTAIVVSLPAGGAGNTNASCTAQGFQL